MNVDAVAFDFDGTLAMQRGGWTLLHHLYGTSASGEERSAAYHAGEISFEEWCQGNVADWRARGVTEADVARAADAVTLTTGAEELLDWLTERDIPFAVISSGVTDLQVPLREYNPAFLLGNDLLFDDGRLVGSNPRVGPGEKGDVLATACADLCVELDRTVYVGDSHTDVEAFEVAGHAVLFDPSDRLPDRAYDLVDEIVAERDLRNVRDTIARLVKSATHD